MNEDTHNFGVHPERVARIELAQEADRSRLALHDTRLAVHDEQISGLRYDIQGLRSELAKFRAALVGAAITFAVSSSLVAVTIYTQLGH